MQQWNQKCGQGLSDIVSRFSNRTVLLIFTVSTLLTFKLRSYLVQQFGQTVVGCRHHATMRIVHVSQGSPPRARIVFES